MLDVFDDGPTKLSCDIEIEHFVNFYFYIETLNVSHQIASEAAPFVIIFKFFRSCIISQVMVNLPVYCSLTGSDAGFENRVVIPKVSGRLHFQQ